MFSQESDSTIVGDGDVSVAPTTSLDLAQLPPVFVLPAHMDMKELHQLEDRLNNAKAPLTYDSAEARVFLGKIAQKRRVLLELKSRGVWSEELSLDAISVEEVCTEPPHKRRKPNEPVRTKNREESSSTDSELDTVSTIGDGSAERDADSVSMSPLIFRKETFPAFEDEKNICVVNLEWFQESFKEETVLPLQKYIAYLGKRIDKPDTSITKPLSVKVESAIASAKSTSAARNSSLPPTNAAQGILERALAESSPNNEPVRSFTSSSQIHKRAAANSSRIAHLVHQTTSEHDYGRSGDLPEMPDWVKRQSNFSCERATPLHGPNDAFVEELKKIRLVRTLTSDEIGVRAYSTSIASIAAYPYTITDQREILALPGCENKIASLWVEWKNRNGIIQAVYDAESDETLKVLRLFYDTWGVGAQTAKEFYSKGWRDLDDIVEYGWNELSRVQQIGVKFYDEFLLKLSRDEVEFIGRKIHEHAQRLREPTGVRTCIVGGHRRGKKESGDVDIIVSHLDEDATISIVEDIVKSLYDEGWITHELITHTSASRRSQATLPFRAGGGGHGFDTLDKALVVWQDPEWSGKGTGEKNPNVHRRVDIIIAPWSKVGCAVLGWSAGMTFERDLRRYARKVKGWKFDSSGVRDRNTGEEVDLEGIGGRCTSIEEAEKKVFKGFGLDWREPWERNTG